MCKGAGKTTARGMKDAGKGIEKGSRIAAHYTGEGAEKTAVGVENVGKETPKAVEGAAVDAGKGARMVVVKTPAGAEETLHLTDRCMVDTGKGVARGTEYTARESEAGGRKVGRMLKRVRKATERRRPAGGPSAV